MRRAAVIDRDRFIAGALTAIFLLAGWVPGPVSVALAKPTVGVSVGSGIAAYHFNATATAESVRDVGGVTDRDASAVHTQAFYVVGPESPTL